MLIVCFGSVMHSFGMYVICRYFYDSIFRWRCDKVQFIYDTTCLSFVVADDKLEWFISGYGS